MNEPNLIKKTYKDYLKQKKVLVILSIFFLIILIGPSYALLSNFKKLDNAVNIKAANMNMSITQSSSIQLEGKLPESDASGLQNADPVTITLKNANTGPFTDTETTKFQNESASTIKIEKYELKLLPDTTKTTTLDNQYIKYAVSTDNGTTYSDPVKLSDSNTIVFTGYNLDLGQTKTILLKIWIDEDSGSNGTNKNYYGSATVEMYQKANEIFLKFAELASSTNYVKSYDDIITQNPTFNTQDTYTTNPNKRPVYYFTSTDSNNYAAQYGNVLFAGFCWQIIRTTDTGGLKLIYNGVAENDKCKTDRTAGKGINGTTGTQKTTMTSATVYGTGFDYDLDAGTFTLTGTTELAGKTWASNSSELIGTYTCLNGNTTCNELYYVGHYQSGTQASTEKYTIGNVDHYSQIGKSVYNAYFDSPALVGYMYNKVYTYANSAKTGNHYANSVTYSNGTYTLVNPTSDVASAPSVGYKYVCNDSEVINGDVITCSTPKVKYYYYNNYHVTLENGDTNPVYVMLNGKTQGETEDANINVYNSAIKGYLDNWYKKNIVGTGAEGKIDTSAIYCNDRSSSNTYGSWNNDATSTTTYLNFRQYSVNKDLKCENTTDRFSADTNNTNAKLTYPVGLLTEPERGLMNTGYTATGQYYWTLSPNIFIYSRAYVRSVATSGGDYYSVYSSYGARPVVSLRPDAEITGGSGTYDSPYRIG